MKEKIKSLKARSINKRHPHSQAILIKLKEGQRIGLKFSKEVDTGQPFKAKNIMVKFFDMDVNWEALKLARGGNENMDDVDNIPM